MNAAGGILSRNGKSGSEGLQPFPLVRFETFRQAIRDSGYKGTASAVAELIDNALEAGAQKVHIELATEPGQDLVTGIRVLDDGEGMTPGVLQTALQFGGSSRFDSRTGLGRYGVGLPCSSLSVARRVDVWSWRNPRAVWWSYLDVEEISRSGWFFMGSKRRENYDDCSDTGFGSENSYRNSSPVR